MSAIGRLWFKWVSDNTKPYTIEDVPSFWRKEVEGLMQQKEAEEAEEVEEYNANNREID